MFTQYFKIVRPNTLAEFYPLSDEFKDKQEKLTELRKERNDLVLDYKLTISDDKLTYEGYIVFRDAAAFKEYRKIVAERKLFSENVTEYYRTHNHSMLIEGAVDDRPRVVIQRIFSK